MDVLEKHLSCCAACGRYADQMNELMVGIADLRAATERAPFTETAAGASAGVLDLNRGRAWIVRYGLIGAAAVLALLLGGGWWVRQEYGGRQGGPTVEQVATAPEDEASAQDQDEFGGALDTTRIVSARSQAQDFIPVRRRTHDAKVKLFLLYKNVSSASRPQ